MSKVIIKQIRSTIGRPETQVRTMKALGLGRIGRTVELKDVPTVRGQIAKIAHLIEIVG